VKIAAVDFVKNFSLPPLDRPREEKPVQKTVNNLLEDREILCMMVGKYFA
jgi:hypothetical protein